jgi:hypothetical protein
VNESKAQHCYFENVQLWRGESFMIDNGERMYSERCRSQCHFFCYESQIALLGTETGPLVSDSMAVISS